MTYVYLRCHYLFVSVCWIKLSTKIICPSIEHNLEAGLCYSVMKIIDLNTYFQFKN